MNDLKREYIDMIRERQNRLEAIGESLHPWQYDRNIGSEIDILEDNNEVDEDMIKHLKNL